MTTNSGAGIEDYGVYYPVFKAMEEEGLVLNLHGEVPSDHEKVSSRLRTGLVRTNKRKSISACQSKLRHGVLGLS